MEDNEREEGGISIGEIFRTIFSQKWIALIVFAVIFVAGTLGLYFINKLKDTYSVTFVLQLPDTGDVSTTSYTYPDGESFYFTDIISYENIKAVSDNPKYESIKVEKLVKEGDISIARDLNAISTDLNNVEVYDLVYTITVKAKYFSSDESAAAFISALAEIPGQYIANMNINYDQNLTTSKTALTYDLQLTQLKNQMLYLQSKYNSFVEIYGENFIIDSDGTTLATCKGNIDKYITEDIFETLRIEALQNSYIKSDDANSNERARYESEYYSKQLERDVEVAALEAYVNRLQSAGSLIISDEQIYNHELKIASIEQEMQILKGYIDSFSIPGKVANPAFEAKIAAVEAEVTKFTDEIKPIASYLYGKVTKVNYLNTNIVEIESGMSIVMSLIISLAVGIVVAAIVAYVVGWNRNKKRGVVQHAAAPVYFEAQAQAAATEDEENKTE